MLFFGVSMLLLGYFTRYLPFEVTSIVALLVGSAFVFTSMESYVKARPANLSIRAPLITLHEMLVRSGLTGKTFYIPGSQGETVKMLVQKSDSAAPNPTDTVDPNDVLLIPPGEGIVRVLAEELNGLTDKQLKYLQEWIPKAVVEGLGLAERMKLDVKGDDLKVQIHRPSFQTLCQDPELNRTVCLRFGCPFSSGMAASLAEGTGRVVEYVGCSHEGKSETSTALYRLGQQIRSLKER